MMQMPKPMTMPAPPPTTGGSGLQPTIGDKPRRRPLPDAPDPGIQCWKHETSNRWIATLNYNGIWTNAVRPTRDMAFDAAHQFYMSYTVEGQNNSEVVG